MGGRYHYLKWIGTHDAPYGGWLFTKEKAPPAEPFNESFGLSPLQGEALLVLGLLGVKRHFFLFCERFKLGNTL